MEPTAQIANQLRAVHFGGNWTAVNLKDAVAGLSWQQATKQLYSLNTIATLVYHMNYYITHQIKVLQGGPLDAKDANSFETPPIHSQEDWEKLLDRVWAEAETFASLIEQMPESKLWEVFIDSKYGNYYRNLTGCIEHFHYHLGQISLIKKILLKESAY